MLTPEGHPDTFIPQLGRSVAIERAAQLLGVSRRTVYNRIKEGRLSTLRTRTGSQRVLLASIEEQRDLRPGSWMTRHPNGLGNLESR
jgi:excisionase family DNA binding protein